MAYDWPGNVRELHNVIERAAILARGDVIGLDELPDLGRGGDMSGSGPEGLAEPLESVAPRAAERREPQPPGAHRAIAGPGSAERGQGGETLKEVERDHMMRVLSEAGWVIEGPEGAAARLGMRPSTLRSRMARLGVRRPAGRT
jgi:formate hydrogenlyase transcriptional activator